MGTDKTLFSRCRSLVNTMTSGMSDYWKNYRKDCGPWYINGVKGDPNGSKCDTSTRALQNNAYYLGENDKKEYVTSNLTNSVKSLLWLNKDLRED